MIIFILVFIATLLFGSASMFNQEFTLLAKINDLLGENYIIAIIIGIILLVIATIKSRNIIMILYYFLSIATFGLFFVRKNYEDVEYFLTVFSIPSIKILQIILLVLGISFIVLAKIIQGFLSSVFSLLSLVVLVFNILVNTDIIYLEILDSTVSRGRFNLICYIVSVILLIFALKARFEYIRKGIYKKQQKKYHKIQNKLKEKLEKVKWYYSKNKKSKGDNLLNKLIILGYNPAKDYHYDKAIKEKNIPVLFDYLGKYIRNKDYKALDLARKLLEYRADSNLEIGICYYLGISVAIDYKIAVTYFLKSKSSERNHYLGICYVEGKGVDKNYKEALKYFKEAIVYYDENINKSYDWLGYMYENGLGCSKSIQYALYYYRKSNTDYARKKINYYDPKPIQLNTNINVSSTETSNKNEEEIKKREEEERRKKEEEERKEEERRHFKLHEVRVSCRVTGTRQSYFGRDVVSVSVDATYIFRNCEGKEETKTAVFSLSECNPSLYEYEALQHAKKLEYMTSDYRK